LTDEEIAEFRRPEVTRFQPLRGIARFYYSAAPTGFLEAGWQQEVK